MIKKRKKTRPEVVKPLVSEKEHGCNRDSVLGQSQGIVIYLSRPGCGPTYFSPVASAPTHGL